MNKRLTNDKGQISELGAKYMEKMQELLIPIFQEMMDNGYDYSDIRMIKDESMRFELVKMMSKRNYGILNENN